MDFKKAISYWDDKDKNNIKMNNNDLSKWLDDFLKNHNTLALATGTDNYIDNTPLEYNYFNGKIYILTEGGHKFIGLEKNDNVAISIFDTYKGFGSINSAQIYGKCVIVEQFSEEYNKILEFKKMPIEAIKKLNLYLLRIEPTTINILCSEFKKKGFSNRQVIDFNK